MGTRCDNYIVRPVYLDDIMAGKPDAFDRILKPGLLYIEYHTHDADPTFTMMLCPCGCGEELGMRVGKPVGTSPLWTLTVDAEGKPTLNPSILHRAGCKSHFFLRNGRVDWC